MAYELTPDIIGQYGGKRQFKIQKRREMNAVLKAFDEFRLGCAYVEGYQEFCDDTEKALSGWREKMSVKNWGR